MNTVQVDQEVMRMQLKFQRIKNSRDERVSELTQEMFETMRKMQKIINELEELVNDKVEFDICRALYICGFRQGKTCQQV